MTRLRKIVYLAIVVFLVGLAAVTLVSNLNGGETHNTFTTVSTGPNQG
jgi:hypothetical protein